MSASASTRGTRSRIASPMTAVPSIETPDPTERPRTMLQNWVATSNNSTTAVTKAAWVRHNVVQNMMALGVGPPAKVLKALQKGESERSRSMASAISTPEPAQETETPTPEDPEEVLEEASAEPSEAPTEQAEPTLPAESIPADTTKPAQSIEAEPEIEVGAGAKDEAELPQRTSPPSNKLEERGDEVEVRLQTPLQPTIEENNASRPIIGPQSTAQSALQTPAPTSQQDPQPEAPPRYPRYLSETPEPALGPDGLAMINLPITDKIVENAVQEALDRHKWPTAYALRILWDDLRTDPNMVRMFDAVYNGWHTHEQMTTFRSMVRAKKCEGRKDRQAEYYFNGDGSDPRPETKGPIFEVINIINPPAPVYQTPYTSVSHRPSMGASEPPQVRSSSAVLPAISAAVSGDAGDEHVRKKLRSNSFQPVSTEVDGHAEANGTKDSDMSGVAKSEKSASPAVTNRVHKVPPRAQRARSNSSSSAFFQEAALSAETQARKAARPISAPPKPGPKLFTFNTNPSASASTSASANTSATTANAQTPALPRPSPTNITASVPTIAAPNDPPPATTTMAATAIVINSSSSSIASSSKKFPAAFKIKNANKAVGNPHDENDGNSRLKRKAKEITGKTPKTESFERHRIPDAAAAEVESDGAESIAVKATTKKQKKNPRLRLINSKRIETRQNSKYASDEGSSPTELAFKPPFPPGDSLPSSRAGTPNAANRPTRKSKTGSGLRVKTSPMKKKTGTSAGIPKDMRSPTSNGGPVTQDGDNDDFCSACGGNGDLVCCDGCTRSFHFKCVDPPMIDDYNSQSDAWFCNTCECKRRGPHGEATSGVWGRLFSDLEDTNPRSYSLPQPIRDYFVDVKTGPDGEYEEIVPPKPKNNRAGWEEAPDYFRKKDAKGKAILCHRCNGEATTPNRMIIPCSFCGLSWHLDCLPNPLAKEPGPGRQWRCPAHIDDLLAMLPTTLAPAHRFRKVKGESVIVPSVSRGIKNGGRIEIEYDLSEDEEQGYYEGRDFGKVYKLPEKSIKLDFISRQALIPLSAYTTSNASSGSWSSKTAPQSRASVAPVSGAQATWDQRSIHERQAALNLASLMVGSTDSAPGDHTESLIQTLLAEAPPTVISLMAQSSSSNLCARKLGKKDKASMTAMFELLKKKLEDAESSSDEEDPAPATPVADQEAAVAPKEQIAISTSTLSAGLTVEGTLTTDETEIS
ncbi:PHD-finger domain-containing protein [Diplocarpon rosae]|nr:PHD-finger domain-containing protein [Diplocarpon rosae]